MQLRQLHRVDLLFDEAVTGAKRQLTLNVDVACGSCKGTGAEKGRLVTCTQCNGTGEVSVLAPFG
jgi:molecular chaperone DnaJ